MNYARLCSRTLPLLLLACLWLLASFLPSPAVRGEATVPTHQVFLPLMLTLPDPAAEFKREVIRLVNIERVNAGCSAAVQNDALMRGTQGWADEMTRRGIFEHSPMGWYRDHGYTGLGSGENLGGGVPENTVRNWMDSEAHRATLLECQYGPSAVYEIGVGYGTTYGAVLVVGIRIQ